MRAPDLALFATPVINLFERDCNLVELDPRRPRQVLHVDRARPRDFEIYRVTALEDADREGPEARLTLGVRLRTERSAGSVLVGGTAAAAAGGGRASPRANADELRR